MTPLARRLILAVVGTLLVALVVLVASLSLGPTARAGLVLLGTGLVVLGAIAALLVRWFRAELAGTNTTSAIEVAAEAGMDADAVGRDGESEESADAPERPDRG
jgi:hypothetical protein